MKQTMLQEKYPIFIAKIDKAETTCQSVDKIVSYLKDKIASNPKVEFIGVFDHYAHTKRRRRDQPRDQGRGGRDLLLRLCPARRPGTGGASPFDRRGGHEQQIRGGLYGGTDETRG